MERDYPGPAEVLAVIKAGERIHSSERIRSMGFV